MGGRVQLRVLTLPPSPAEREGCLVQAARGSPICETPGLHSGFSCGFSQTLQHNPSRPGPALQQTHPKGQHQGRRAPAARTTTTPEGKNPLCWKIVGGEAGRDGDAHSTSGAMGWQVGRGERGFGCWWCPAGCSEVVAGAKGRWVSTGLGWHNWARPYRAEKGLYSRK